MKSTERLLLALVFSALLVSPVAAQWKWRDVGGRIQYSDRPPPAGVPDRDILQRPAAGSSATAPRNPVAAAAPSASSPSPVAVAAGTAGAAPAASAASAASAPVRSDPVLEARRRDAERAEAARKKLEADTQVAARADNCQRAQTQLRTLDAGQRISRINVNGEREILDDSARAVEAARARTIIASDCR